MKAALTTTFKFASNFGDQPSDKTDGAEDKDWVDRNCKKAIIPVTKRIGNSYSTSQKVRRRHYQNKQIKHRFR